MGKNRPRMKSTNKRMDLSKWESLRTGRACPCGGLWVSGSVSVGKNRPRMKSTNKRMDLSKWESLRSGWACPCGGLWVSAGVSVRLDE